MTKITPLTGALRVLHLDGEGCPNLLESWMVRDIIVSNPSLTAISVQGEFVFRGVSAGLATACPPLQAMRVKYVHMEDIAQVEAQRA